MKIKKPYVYINEKKIHKNLYRYSYRKGTPEACSKSSEGQPCQRFHVSWLKPLEKRSSTRKFSGLMCFKNKHKLKRLNETNIWHMSFAQPIWAVFKLSLFNFFHKSMNVN